MNFKVLLLQLPFLPTTCLILANIITIGNEIHSDLHHRSQCAQVTEQTISDCLQPILTYANSIQQTSTNGSPFSLQGGEIFKKLCTLYNGFKECTHGISCHSISLEAVEASYGYMCGSGQKLFEKHAACFAIIESQSDYALCRNAAGQAMDDAVKAKKNELDVYFQKLCQIMDDYLRCCRPFVIDRCGQDAWRLVSQITIDSLRVTMPSCEISNALT